MYELLPVTHPIPTSQTSSAQLQSPSIHLRPYLGYGHLKMQFIPKCPFWQAMNLTCNNKITLKQTYSSNIIIKQAHNKSF